MAKFFLRTGSAIVGIVLAIVLYMNFGIFEIKTVFMYPALKPGQHVLIHKTSAEQISIGDLVLFEAPFYDFDTQEGMLAVRRVSGIKDGTLRLECDAPAVAKDVLAVDEESGRGKVILWQKKNES